MKYWVGITHRQWFEFLAARQDVDEVNFWQPRGGRPPIRLEIGAPFLFKLHAADGGWVVGGGSFLHWTSVPIRLAWEAFGEKNGADSIEQMAKPIRRYRGGPIEIETDPVGCMILGAPWFLPPAAWIAPPADWAPNLVQGRTYDSDTSAGAILWEQAEAARVQYQAADDRPATADAVGHVIAEARYGKPTLVLPRLGQRDLQAAGDGRLRPAMHDHRGAHTTRSRRRTHQALQRVRTAQHRQRTSASIGPAYAVRPGLRHRRLWWAGACKPPDSGSVGERSGLLRVRGPGSASPTRSVCSPVNGIPSMASRYSLPQLISLASPFPEESR